MAHRWPEADAALRDDRGRGGGRSARSTPRRRCARWRDGVGAAPATRASRRGSRPTGYERVAEHVARLARFEFVRQRRRAGGDRRRARRQRAGAGVRARSTCEAEKRRAAERARAAAQGDRARRGQARQPGLRREGAGRPSSQAERDKLERLEAGAGGTAGVTWDLGRAEEHLLSLELFGMRFGLERMRRLLTVLGSPQERFGAVHVVGTNGKSSTVRMTAALLEAHGAAHRRVPVAAPDARSPSGSGSATPICRRTRFGAAIERAAAAAAKVDRTLAGGERVTQFELLTAAAFDELARREVDVAVVEAGPRRALGRDQRARRAGRRAHQRRARAHALARPDDRRHRGREARRRAAGRDAGARRRRSPRWSRWPRATGRQDRAAEPRRRRLPGYQRTNFAVAAAAASAYPRPPARPRGRRARGRARRGPRAPAGRRRATRARSSTAPTTRPGSRRSRSRAARGGRRRAGSSPCSRSSTTRTRRRCCARCCRAAAALVFTARPNPRALPPATLAVAGRAARRRRQRDRAATRARRSRAHASWRAPTAPCSRPARSTWSADLLERAPGARRASAL